MNPPSDYGILAKGGEGRRDKAKNAPAVRSPQERGSRFERGRNEIRLMKSGAQRNGVLDWNGKNP